MITPDQEENFLQGLLASAGYIDSAMKRLLKGNIPLAIRYMGNALIILNKLIKSIRGF